MMRPAEAQLVHVCPDLAALVLLLVLAVAQTRVQFGGFLLTAQNRNAVLAAVGALAAFKHAATEAVVVVECGQTLRVGCADLLRNLARDGRLLEVRALYARPTHLDACLRRLAVVVILLAVTGHEAAPVVSGGERDERQLTGLRAVLVGRVRVHDSRAAVHVVLQRHRAARVVDALQSHRFAAAAIRRAFLVLGGHRN